MGAHRTYYWHDTAYLPLNLQFRPFLTSKDYRTSLYSQNWYVTYIVEVLRGPHNKRRLLILVILHPSLTKKFPIKKRNTFRTLFFLPLKTKQSKKRQFHSLIWDDLEDQMVQKGELLCNLQGWVALERVSLSRTHLKGEKHTWLDRSFAYDSGCSSRRWSPSCTPCLLLSQQNAKAKEIYHRNDIK